MPTEKMIPLNQLTLSKANVRRTAANEGICELATSIAANGLRRNLSVLPSIQRTRGGLVLKYYIELAAGQIGIFSRRFDFRPGRQI